VDCTATLCTWIGGAGVGGVGGSAGVVDDDDDEGIGNGAEDLGVDGADDVEAPALCAGGNGAMWLGVFTAMDGS